MRKTKIICTMGPNTNDRAMMKRLAEEGMNIARFNFSHGSHEEQKGRMDLLKSVREEIGKPIAILLDTKGPEIRTGVLKDGKKVMLEAGEMFTLTTEEIEGDAKKVSITYDGLAEDVEPGKRILIDDGLIELEVKTINGNEITCKVVKWRRAWRKKGCQCSKCSGTSSCTYEERPLKILFLVWNRELTLLQHPLFAPQKEFWKSEHY